MAKTTLLEEWNDLSESERVGAFESLPRDQAAAFFLQLSSRDQLGLLLALREGERRIWLRLLPPDDAADLLQLASLEDRDRLAGQLDETAQREVNALLAYKQDAAGGLINLRFARLRPDMTRRLAIFGARPAMLRRSITLTFSMKRSIYSA